MDPAIAGTLSPPSTKFNQRIKANADGSLLLEVYRIPEDAVPLALAVRVSNLDSVVMESGDKTTENILEQLDAGERIYYLKLDGSTLPPGGYIAHRLARRLDTGQPEVIDYETFVFTVPDTPFTRAVFSQYVPSTGLIDLIIKELIDDDLLKGVVDTAVAEESLWTYWQ